MVKKKKGTVFMCLGLLLIAAACALTGYNVMDNQRAGNAAAAVLDQLDFGWDVDYEMPDVRLEPDAMPVETVENNKYIGKIEIPSLDISLPVMSGWDYDKLRIAPCQYSGSYLTNDLVIAGHNYARHFNPLKWIDTGADVYFTAVNGIQYHYVVNRVEQLQAIQTSLMVESNGWDLTLFTCTTGGQNRCTVRCVQVVS